MVGLRELSPRHTRLLNLPEIQRLCKIMTYHTQVRMADCKDLRTALAYALRWEMASQSIDKRKTCAIAGYGKTYQPRDDRTAVLELWTDGSQTVGI